jgi:hypothetical protein
VREEIIKLRDELVEAVESLRSASEAFPDATYVDIWMYKADNLEQVVNSLNGILEKYDA